MLADELMSEHAFIFTNGDSYLYQSGVYRPIGIEFVKRNVERSSKKHPESTELTEVIAHIQDTSCIEGENSILIKLDKP